MKQVPEKVAIVAMGDSRAQYIADVTKAGSRKGVADEVWVINKLADCFVHDVLFRMDDLMEPRKNNMKVIQDRHGVNIHDRFDKVLREHPGPIITSKAYPDEYPGSVEYPLEKVINHIGYSYFATTPAYAVAFASLIGVKEVVIYGCDYNYYYNPSIAEEGRGNMEFVTGICMMKGLKVSVAAKSSLMNTCLPLEEQFYGYKDFLEVRYDQETEKYRVVQRDDMKELLAVTRSIEELEAYKKLIDVYGVQTLEAVDTMLKQKDDRRKEIEQESGKKVIAA